MRENYLLSLKNNINTSINIQICSAAQFFHSLKRRAPLPSRSAASKSAFLGASIPTSVRRSRYFSSQCSTSCQVSPSAWSVSQAAKASSSSCSTADRDTRRPEAASLFLRPLVLQVKHASAGGSRSRVRTSSTRHRGSRRRTVIFKFKQVALV